MKLTSSFKAILFATCAALFVTGSWIFFPAWLSTEPPSAQPFVPPLLLMAHGIGGLLFLALFGYLWRAHIEPGLRDRKKRTSGLALLMVFLAVLLTLPFLYYSGGDALRWSAVKIHSAVGLFLLAPFAVHFFSKSF